MDVEEPDAARDAPPAQTSRQKILEFKQKVIWRLCTDLLDPPVPSVGRLRFPADMSEYDRQEARRRHEDALLNRELELKRREPELLSRLEDIMLRIVQSRGEQVVDNSEVWATPKAEQQGLEFECDVCGNKDQRSFLRDGSTGDTICLGADKSGCGNVVQDHRVDEGSQFRTFADDEGKDRNHHGPAPDPLMPDSENMKTAMLGMGSTFKKLNQANQFVEMNLSNIGNDDRRTRTSYRNQHKRAAFQLMEDAAEQLGIHDSVVGKAREQFARFRDVREHVISYHGVVAACLAISFEELVLSNQLPTMKKAADAGPVPTSAWVKQDQGLDAKQAIEKAAGTDPILSTQCDRPLKTWNMQELETWLRVVFAPHCEIDGTAQIAAIRSRLDSGGGPDPAPARGGSVSASTLSLLSAARKRGPVGEAPSWMGSTTTANRAKKSKLNNGAAGGTSIVRPGVEAQPLGHSFLRIDLDTVLQGAPVVVLRAALKTRLKFDAWAAGKLAEHELEEKRLVQEKADFRMFDAKDKAGDSRSQKIIEEISIVPSSGHDDMMAMMLSAAPSESSAALPSGGAAPVARLAPRIRMAVVSGGQAGSPTKPRVVVKTEGQAAVKSEESPTETKSKYFYESGKRMRMVKRVRTDGRTGKQIIIDLKEEVPSDWESDDDSS